MSDKSDKLAHQQTTVRDFILARPRSETLWLRKRLCALEVREQLRLAGRQPRSPVEFTSQYGEDCWLWELFQGKLDGFFIEVGAYDGYSLSVSYPFESIGWKGLLIEPIPERYEACKQRRPASRVVHAALGAAGSQGTCSFTNVMGGRHDMLSFLKTTAESYAEVRSSGAQTRVLTVPLTSMDVLLADHQGPIDFAVLDVEGGEIELLKGFDLARHRPRVLMIEEGLPSKSTPTMEYMAKFPYTPVAFAWINRVYIHNDEKDLIEQAKNIGVW